MSMVHLSQESAGSGHLGIWVSGHLGIWASVPSSAAWHGVKQVSEYLPPSVLLRIAVVEALCVYGLPCYEAGARSLDVFSFYF